MLMVVMMILILTPASLSDQYSCDNPEDPLTFDYECLSRKVELCIPGRHLKVSQPECDGEVDEDEICVPCEEGTFMDANNHCNTCKNRTVCGPDEIEAPDSPHSAKEDRTCMPRPQTEVTTPSTGPVSPEYPNSTLSLNSTLSPVTSTEKRQELQYERDKWRLIAIVFIVLFIITVIIIVLLIIALYVYWSRRHREDDVENTANGHARVLQNGDTNPQSEPLQNYEQEQQVPNPEVCASGQQNNSQDLNGDLPKEHSDMQSGEEASLNSNSPPTTSTGQTQADDCPSARESTPLEEENSLDKYSHLGSHDGQGSHKPPPVKKDYDVKENTESMLPLLASENRNQSESPSISQNPDLTTNGEGIHNSPTAHSNPVSKMCP